MIKEAFLRIPEELAVAPVAGRWLVEPTFQPTPSERTFTNPFVIAQVTRQGCSYIAPSDLGSVRSYDLVGKTASHCVATAPLPLKLALLDALFAAVDLHPENEVDAVTLNGTVSSKATHRAALVAQEVRRFLGGTGDVALIGYSGQIAKTLFADGFAVRSYDLDDAILNGASRADGHGAVRPAGLFFTDALPDLVVATGMTLATNTFGAIAQFCHRHQLALFLYCQTAPNLADFLISQYAVERVLAEHIPFYNWEGISPVTIHRRSRQ